MKRNIQVIPLNLILLDQENVRFGGDIAQSQREALELLMADSDDARKLLRLAKDIAENGLDPTELQLVTPAPEGSYIVLEGNRRLAALKLLQRPDLCPNEKLVKSFIAAQATLNGNLPNDIECSVIATREAGDRWVQLKHTGQNNGVGRVNWDSNIIDERRARQTGIESIGRQIRILIQGHPAHFKEDRIEQDIMEIPVSTLSRLFSSRPSQETLQLKIENKQLVPQLPLEFIAPALKHIIRLFIELDYNVNDIRNDEDRRQFFENHVPPELNPLLRYESANQPFEEPETEAPYSPYSDQPPAQSPTDTFTPSGAQPADPAAATPDIDNPGPGAKPGGRTRSKPSSLNRKYLLPWPLNISNSRINQIYRELRYDLKVDETINAVAITFRVFIEVTCDDYVLKHTTSSTPVLRIDNKKPVTDNDKLHIKVQAIARHLQEQKLLDKNNADTIVRRAGTHSEVGSIDHFNQFVHSSVGGPIPSELKTIAEEYKPFLEAIWR